MATPLKQNKILFRLKSPPSTRLPNLNIPLLFNLLLSIPPPSPLIITNHSQTYKPHP